MSASWHPKRIFVCTFTALISGILSAYIGTQISLQINRQKCQNQPWGLKTACHTWVIPGAIWRGGTLGLSLGVIIGGVTSAIATSQPTLRHREQSSALFADELELTPAQRELLHRFLVLVMLKLASRQTASETEDDPISVEELQQLLAIAKQQHLLPQDLTLTRVEQILKSIGFYRQNSLETGKLTVATEQFKTQSRQVNKGI